MSADRPTRVAVDLLDSAASEGRRERRSAKARVVFQPVRVAISGTSVSPGIFESVALLGREEALSRIDAALAQT